MGANQDAPGINFDEIRQEEWDAARRMAEAVNLHIAAGREMRQENRAGFVAIDLADGRSPDGTLYPSRLDAVKGQKGNKYRFFVKIGPKDMSEREALVCLMYARRAFAAGHVFAEEEPLMPQRLEIAQPFIPRALRGLGGSFRRG
jgi:hypothetical protein